MFQESEPTSVFVNVESQGEKLFSRETTYGVCKVHILSKRFRPSFQLTTEDFAEVADLQRLKAGVPFTAGNVRVDY